jgi:predicted  nucleic acid-binding Zn-ribbon protein
MPINFTNLDKTNQLHNSYEIINKNINVTDQFIFSQQNYYKNKYLEDTLLTDILQNSNFNICKKLIFYENTNISSLQKVGSPLPVLQNNVLKVYKNTSVRYKIIPQIRYDIFYIYVEGVGNYTLKYRLSAIDDFKEIPALSLIKPDTLWNYLEIEISAIEDLSLNGFGVFYDYVNNLNNVKPFLNSVIYFENNINVDDLFTLPIYIYPSTQIFDYKGDLLVSNIDYQYINYNTIKFLKPFRKSDYIFVTDLYNIQNNVSRNNEILNQLNKDLQNNLTLLQQQFGELSDEITELEGYLNNTQTNLENAITNYNNVNSQIITIINNMQNIVINIDNQLDVIETTINNINTTLNSLNNKQLTDFTTEININFVNYFNSILTNLETQLSQFINNSLPTNRYNDANSIYLTEYNKFNDFENRNNTINSRITSLNNGISTLQPNLTGYNNRITIINTNLQNIENDLASKEEILNTDIQIITNDKDTLVENVNTLNIEATNYFNSIEGQLNNAVNNSNTTLINTQPYLININNELTNFTASFPSDCIYDLPLNITITQHSTSIMGDIFYQLKTPENKIYNYPKQDTITYTPGYDTTNINQTKTFYLRASNGYHTTEWVGYNVLIRNYKPPVAVLNSDPDHGTYPVLKEYKEYTINITSPDGTPIIDSNVTFTEISWAYNTSFKNPNAVGITITKVNNSSYKIKIDNASWNIQDIGTLFTTKYRFIDPFIRLTISATESHYSSSNTVINNIQIRPNYIPVSASAIYWDGSVSGDDLKYVNSSANIRRTFGPVVGSTYSITLNLYDDDTVKGITTSLRNIVWSRGSGNVGVTFSISGYSLTVNAKINSLTWDDPDTPLGYILIYFNISDKHSNSFYYNWAIEQ